MHISYVLIFYLFFGVTFSHAYNCYECWSLLAPGCVFSYDCVITHYHSVLYAHYLSYFVGCMKIPLKNKYQMIV
ncbi:unnamed protein product [Rotaria sordida]|uniref:Secreted protein n=1 Tax=Rotaria sordida TaxID=392033 RepID=A0A816DVL4_9BILA|nr:unnamed protein product [Rotaria sordida]CAF1638885.1 unnamed protein product [Rotaria sordida]